MPTMEPIQKVAKDLESNMKHLGLYMIDINFATSDTEAINPDEEDGALKEDFRKKMADGETMWMVNAVFNIGDQAFTDRVLNPEKEAADTEFAVAVPDEIEMMREKLRREGLAAFEPDDLTDD